MSSFNVLKSLWSDGIWPTQLEKDPERNSLGRWLNSQRTVVQRLEVPETIDGETKSRGAWLNDLRDDWDKGQRGRPKETPTLVSTVDCEGAGEVIDGGDTDHARGWTDAETVLSKYAKKKYAAPYVHAVCGWLNRHSYWDGESSVEKTDFCSFFNAKRKDTSSIVISTIDVFKKESISWPMVGLNIDMSQPFYPRDDNDSESSVCAHRSVEELFSFDILQIHQPSVFCTNEVFHKLLKEGVSAAYRGCSPNGPVWTREEVNGETYWKCSDIVRRREGCSCYNVFDVVDDDPRKREMGRLVNSRYQWYVAINSSSENIKNQCRRSDDAAIEPSK